MYIINNITKNVTPVSRKQILILLFLYRMRMMGLEAPHMSVPLLGSGLRLVSSAPPPSRP